ncbi:MAG: alanine--glyoxylate aminotransferase family protein [Thermaerobacter sp.]|nr:alanine--glyoxylate aminotransferase family protein [Thermaerobacter sp.]
MFYSPHILLPGPTPVPETVERAMMTSMSDHRGALFDAVRQRVPTRLHDLFHLDPDGRVAVLPASGTGGLEAVVQNFLQPGDPVLVVEGGLFGQRFVRSAEAVGLTVRKWLHPWGTAFDPASIVEELDRHPVKAVLVTHNETSTGVLNPLNELAAMMKSLPARPLLVADSISGIPSVPLDMAGWGVDVAVAASQKGFMVPPGLAFVAASGRAREHLQANRPGRYYFDLTPYFDNNFPYTPAISLWYGLDQALSLLIQEGESLRFARHQLMSRMVRAFGAAGGFSLPVDEAVASPTVTAYDVPSPLIPSRIRQAAAAEGLEIAGGLGRWHETGIRIGHVGALDIGDLWAGLGMLAHHMPQPEAALAAAFDVWKTAR